MSPLPKPIIPNHDFKNILDIDHGSELFKEAFSSKNDGKYVMATQTHGRSVIHRMNNALLQKDTVKSQNIPKSILPIHHSTFSHQTKSVKTPS